MTAPCSPGCPFSFRTSAEDSSLWHGSWNKGHPRAVIHLVLQVRGVSVRGTGRKFTEFPQLLPPTNFLMASDVSPKEHEARLTNPIGTASVALPPPPFFQEVGGVQGST